MEHCGIDLHLKSSEVCVLDEAGELVETARIPTTEVGLRRWFGGRASLARAKPDGRRLAPRVKPRPSTPLVPDNRERRCRMTAAPVKSTVPLSALEVLDIRVGTIESVEDVPKSAKLVRLTVSFGDHRRTVLAGMKQERANPAEIQGRQALFVVNLEPRMMMGEVSEGMLLDLGSPDGITPVLAVPERPVPDGTRAG